MFYSTGVTNELVRTLGLSDKTPPGLPGLKPSSNSVLPVAWITRPATDLKHVGMVYDCQFLPRIDFVLSNFTSVSFLLKMFKLKVLVFVL